MKSRTFVPRLTLLKYRFKSILFLIAIATEKLQGFCVLFFAVVSFRRGGGGGEYGGGKEIHGRENVKGCVR